MSEIAVDLVGGSSRENQLEDPVPSFHRGLFFNGKSTYMTMKNLNLGTDFAVGYWLKP